MDYSLSDLLDRTHENQLSMEAALRELVLHTEKKGGHVTLAKMPEEHYIFWVKMPIFIIQGLAKQRIVLNRRLCFGDRTIGAFKKRQLLKIGQIWQSLHVIAAASTSQQPFPTLRAPPPCWRANIDATSTGSTTRTASPFEQCLHQAP